MYLNQRGKKNYCLSWFSKIITLNWEWEEMIEIFECICRCKQKQVCAMGAAKNKQYNLIIGIAFCGTKAWRMGSINVWMRAHAGDVEMKNLDIVCIQHSGYSRAIAFCTIWIRIACVWNNGGGNLLRVTQLYYHSAVSCHNRVRSVKQHTQSHILMDSSSQFVGIHKCSNCQKPKQKKKKEEEEERNEKKSTFTYC